MKINQLKAGVVLSYTTQFIHILTGIIYTPIMLRLLGKSEYGLNQLVSSVVSYLSLLSLGFSASYMRFYSRYKANNDSDGVAKLNGMYMVIFAFIALLCILCGSVMVINADVIFGDGLTTGELAKARVLMSMLIFNMAISFINSVFSSNVTAHEKFFFQRVLELTKTVFSPLLTLPLLIMGYGSIGMTVISSFLTIFGFLVNILYCFKKLQIRFCFKDFNFALLKEMWVFNFFIFLNMIIDQINWSVDKFLLGRIAGTTVVAVYGVAASLNFMYVTFSTTISSVFVPRVNMLVADDNDNDKLTDLFTRVGRVQFIIMALMISGYIIFGREFISIWAGGGYEEAYRVGLLLMVPAAVPLVQNLGIEIQRAKNKHKVRSVVYFFVAISNIFISIPCISKWGATGAALGTAISLFVGNGLFMNIYYHKKMQLNILYFWKQILRFIPALIIPVLFGVGIRYILPTEKLIFIGIAIILYTAVYGLSMWFIGMNDSEKNLIGKPIKRIGAKLCRK